MKDVLWVTTLVGLGIAITSPLIMFIGIMVAGNNLDYMSVIIFVSIFVFYVGAMIALVSQLLESTIDFKD